MSIELDGVAEQLKEERGVWRSCSGCHEQHEGVAQGPWSYVFECNLGMGCHECGGLGAIWDNVDYSDFGREAAATACDVGPVAYLQEHATFGKELSFPERQHRLTEADKVAGWSERPLYFG